MATLVVTVGTGRYRSDIAKAILFCINTHRPHKTVFLCSEITAKETMPLIEKQLTNIEYEVLSYPHQDDVQYLYQVYLEQLKKYDDITVDFTSGTKAMSAAAFAAAISVGAKKVSYVTGPRDSTGRVTESTEVMSLSPVEVIAERHLQQARELFGLYDFHAAAELADVYRKTLPKDSKLRAWAKTIWMVSSAYDLWDHFKWKKARQLLKKAANPREGLVDVDTAQLDANGDFVDTLVREPWGNERLIDLASNARRRLEQCRFDDALARLYRAYEYLVQDCLWNDFGIDTGRFTVADLKKHKFSRKTLERWRRKAGQAKNRLNASLREAMELLAELDHPIGKELMRIYWKKPWDPEAELKSADAGPLQGWLNQRNSSFLAHGTDPAKESTVKSMLKEYDRILRILISPEKMEKLEEQARFVVI